MNPYRQDKILQHPDRIRALCRGEHPAPVHVQLIISDLCNQACGTCLTETAFVDTLHGQKRISDIRVGDNVWGADGKLHTVTEIGSRTVDKLYAITIDGNTIEASAEHPILTADGWTPASNVRIGDSAVVRVRVREEYTLESPLEAVGYVCLRPRTRGANSLFRLESENAPEDSRHVSTYLSLRVRTPSLAGDTHSPGSLGGLPPLSPEPWTNRLYESGRSRQELGTHASKQSDATPWSCFQSLSVNERKISSEISARSSKYLRGIEAPDVIGPESYAQSRETSEGHCVFPRQTSVENGIAVQGVGSSEWFASSQGWRWNALGWTQESGFPCDRPEESNRNNTEGMLYRKEDPSQLDDLRSSNNRPLSQKALGLLGSLRKGSLPLSRDVDRDHQGLFLGNVPLERGLAVRPVDRVVILEKPATVYNFTCLPGHTYEANGIIVHNCCYRTDGYSSNQLFFSRDTDGEILSRNPARLIPVEKVQEILEDCAAMGVKAIEITGGGEPTVHSQHATIFQMVRDLGMDLGVVTNGVSMDDRALGPLASPGGETWVRVSVDAGTQETYTRTRGCPARHWDLAWRTVRRLVEAKMATLRSPLVVGVSFVLTEDNWREVVRATELAHEAGADNIRIGGLFQNARTQYYDPFREEAIALCSEAASLATNGFTVVNLFGDRYQDLVQGPPDYHTCGYQRFATYIGGDLNLYRCCVQSYNHRGLIGSLKDQRFSEVWAGLADSREYLQFDAHGCAMCQHNTKNRAIANLIDAQRHGGFV